MFTHIPHTHSEMEWAILPEPEMEHNSDPLSPTAPPPPFQIRPFKVFVNKLLILFDMTMMKKRIAIEFFFPLTNLWNISSIYLC